MLCVVSPYGFVCVTVKVKRGGGSEREAVCVCVWGGGAEEEDGYLRERRAVLMSGAQPVINST